MGFELMIKFIELFDTVHDYTLQFTVLHMHAHTSAHSHVFTTVAC
jgi:hypothetical protein